MFDSLLKNNIPIKLRITYYIGWHNKISISILSKWISIVFRTPSPCRCGYRAKTCRIAFLHKYSFNYRELTDTLRSRRFHRWFCNFYVFLFLRTYVEFKSLAGTSCHIAFFQHKLTRSWFLMLFEAWFCVAEKN